jgi:hypothetical protein
VFASGLTFSFWRFRFMARMHNPLSMSNSQSTSFDCPNCAAKYEVVRAEAPPGPTIDREITCLSCGGPLHGRRGRSCSSISWLNGQGGGPLAVAEPHTNYQDNPRKSTANAARSPAVQDLARRLTLIGFMRISDPNGVSVTELSSI